MLRWYDSVSGNRFTRSAGTDKRFAERERARIESEINAGRFREITTVTWSEFVTDHVAKIEGKCNAYIAQLTLDRFGEICKPASPDRVTFGMIEEFVAELKRRGSDRGGGRRDVSTATINKQLRSLRTALKRAVRRNVAEANPMDGWEWVRENRKIPRALTEAEKLRLLEKCPTSQWRALVFLALTTGCRRNELLGLTWDRVSFDRAEIIVTQTKGKADRLQPLPDPAVAMLRELQADTLAAGGPFRSLRSDFVTKRFRVIAESAKVAGCTFHGLRSTFLTDLARAGVNQIIARELAGHASAATTERYYQAVDLGMKRDAVQAVSGWAAAG